MNESTSTTPSLFALTAPKDRGRREAAPAEGFADELSAASSTAPKSQQEPSASAATEDDSRHDHDKDDSTRAEAVVGTQQQEEPATDEAAETAASEAALLSVTVATETVVAETSLNAILPEEAATTLDVGVETPEPSTAVEGQNTDQGGQEASTITLAFAGLATGATEQQAAISSEALADSTDAEAIQVAAVGLPVDEALSEPDAAEEAALDPSLEEPAIAGELNQDASDGEAAAASGIDPDTEAASAIDLAEESSAAGSAAEPSEDEASTDGDETDNRPPTPIKAAPTGTETQTAPSANTTNTTDTGGGEPTVGPTGSAAGANNDRVGVDQAESIASRPTVDASRFVSRVAGAVNSANERGGPIEIRLSPPELGALRVSIEVKEGVLTAQLEAETPAARATLLDNLPALRERLEQQHIRIEKFDVDVRDEANQRDGDWQPPDRGEQRRDEHSRRDERSDRQEPRAQTTAPREVRTPIADPAAPRTITFEDNGINLVA